MQPITNFDLQKIYDAAKVEWGSRHNVEYESHLWVALCYIRAYCAFIGAEPPKELFRDFYGPSEDDTFQDIVLPKGKV